MGVTDFVPEERALEKCSICDKVAISIKGPIVNYVPGGGGGFGGGYNFKTSPFLGGTFFTGKKHEGGQMAGTIIFSFTDLFKNYNTCYSDL